MIKAQFSNSHTLARGETMLNEALRLLRVFHDMSQKDMAARLQISAPYLSEIEAGKKQPTYNCCKRSASEFKFRSRRSCFFRAHGRRNAGTRLKTTISAKVLRC